MLLWVSWVVLDSFILVSGSREIRLRQQNRASYLEWKAISRTIKTERDINLHSSSYPMRPQKQPPTIFLLDIFLKRFFISESEVYDPDSE